MKRIYNVIFAVAGCIFFLVPFVFGESSPPNSKMFDLGKLKPVDSELKVKSGDLAPDFTLYDIEGRESITLSDFRGKKPVALVFGSFT